MLINSSVRRQIKNLATDLYGRVRHEHFQNELDYAIETLISEVEKKDKSTITVDENDVDGVIIPFAPMYSAVTTIVKVNGEEYVRCPDDWIVLLVTNDSARLVRETVELLRPYHGNYEDSIVNGVVYKTATNRDFDGIFDLLYC